MSCLLPLVVHSFGASFSHFCVFLYARNPRASEQGVLMTSLSEVEVCGESPCIARPCRSSFSFAFFCSYAQSALSQRVCTLFDLLYNHFFLDGGGDAFCVKCGRFVLSSWYVGMEVAKKGKTGVINVPPVVCCGVDRVWGAFCASICERLGWLARGYVPLGFAFDFVQSSNYWNYNCNSEWFHLDFFFGARGELGAKGVRFEWSFLVGSGCFYFGLKWL